MAIKLTRTAMQLMMSKKFWQQRCTNQLIYIQHIEESDRRPERKVELQVSALDIYRYCQLNLKDLELFFPNDGPRVRTLQNCFRIS